MSITRSRARAGLAAAGATTLLLTGCGGEGSAGQSASGPEEVTLLLSYLHDVQNAHYYFAQDRGWDEQCGMDLTIETAADVENPMQLLVGGAVDFALVDPLSYVSAVHQGVPVIAVGEDVAVTPVAYAALADQGVTDLPDLVGKTVGIEPGGDSEWFFDKMLADNLAADQAARVTTVSVGYGLQSLLTGQVDVKSLWPTNTDVNARIAEGDEFTFLRAADYGITVPGNLIVTTQQRVEQDPESVERFLGMVLNGMADSQQAEFQEEAVAAASSRMEDQVPEEVIGRAYEALWDVRTSDVWTEHGLGWNDPAGYAQAQEILLANGQIDEEVPVEELYTDEFLEAVTPDGELRAVEQLCA
ncbi:ABC transporter substrate-binding protein [Blastococcus sp. SYSU DS0539]